MAKARKNAADIAKKWSRGVAGSQEAFTNGVNAVLVSPTDRAVEMAEDWHRKMADDETKKRYVAGLQRVSLAEWKKAMLEKGMDRARTGAAKAEGKVQKFMTWWLGQVDTIVGELPARGTLEDNIRRSSEFIRQAAQLRGQGKDAARR